MKSLNFKTMKNTLPILFFILLNLGCKQHPENEIPYLNGYWEIKKVTLSSGQVHDYKYNGFVDYFEVNDSLNGYRKKLKPRMDGTFETTESEEHFIIKIENDSLNMYYSTPFATWKETVLSANDSELKIINTNKDIFIYTPYNNTK